MTLMNSLSDLILEIVSVIDTPRPVKEGICRFHRAIFEAIERHDEVAAQQLMLEHIGHVQDGIGETLAQQLQSEETGDGNLRDNKPAVRRRRVPASACL